mgnify:CR=1 FL=1
MLFRSFPQRSCDIVKEKIDKIESELITIRSILLSLHKEISRLENGIKRDSDELELYLAGVSSQREAEGNLVIMTGFAPVETGRKLQVCSLKRVFTI